VDTFHCWAVLVTLMDWADEPAYMSFESIGGLVCAQVKMCGGGQPQCCVLCCCAALPLCCVSGMCGCQGVPLHGKLASYWRAAMFVLKA
jgi:hypothetical protein